MPGDSWANALTGIGARSRESDEDLRKRILYVAGDNATTIERAHRAHGQQLDDKAEEYGLKWRVS